MARRVAALQNGYAGEGVRFSDQETGTSDASLRSDGPGSGNHRGRERGNEVSSSHVRLRTRTSSLAEETLQ
jgi:hypothetical protein